MSKLSNIFNRIISIFNRNKKREVKRKLASIQVIKEIIPITGADNIVAAKILGWTVVIRKDEFSVGDKAVFVEVDGVLPERPEFEFMRDRKFRIKTIRLKKCLSQGLAFPISILPAGSYEVGDDVTEVLGITKYEPPVDNRGKNGFNQGNAVSDFPRFLSKTDELRIQSEPELIGELSGKPYVITEKYDGTSATYALFGDKFYICSRNFQKNKDDDSVYSSIARKYDIHNVLKRMLESWDQSINEIDGIAIQGEIVGPSIQGNPLCLKEVDLFVFTVVGIRDPHDNIRIPTQAAEEMVKLRGLKHVPIIEVAPSFSYSMEDLLEKAKRKYSGTDRHAEGIVIRHASNEPSEILYGNPLSFKAINNDFLLKEE
jgi:RNA ligase (TIGR02306 family)